MNTTGRKTWNGPLELVGDGASVGVLVGDGRTGVGLRVNVAVGVTVVVGDEQLPPTLVGVTVGDGGVGVAVGDGGVGKGRADDAPRVDATGGGGWYVAVAVGDGHRVGVAVGVPVAVGVSVDVLVRMGVFVGVGHTPPGHDVGDGMIA